jgi:PAS domain S-box-containing protein
MSVLCAILISAIATLVLLGWTLRITPLQTGLLGSVVMRPNTAVALLLAAAALVVQRRLTARGLSALVFLIGSVTLLEYVLGQRIIADLLFADGLTDVQMAARAALALSFAGLAGLLVEHGTIAPLCAGVAGYLGFAGAVARLYGAQLAQETSASPLASSTAILIAIWSIGFLARTSDGGPVALLLARDRWGRAVRLMLLVSLMAPIALGVLCLAGVRRGWFDATFAVALVVSSAGFTLIFVSMRFVSRLRESETLYRTIVETAQEGICTLDGELRIAFVNDCFASMLGYTPEELIGRPGIDIVHEDDRDALLQRVSERERGTVMKQADLRLRHRHQKVLHVISSASAIRLAEGSNGLLVMAVDITERVASEQTLRRTHEILSERVASLEGVEAEAVEHSVNLARQREQVEALAVRLAATNEELETFSYSVSHDLRAPLRAIDGFSRELQLSSADRLDETEAKYLARIRAATRRMSQLIDDLLNLSRLARKPLRRHVVDVTALARAVAAETSAASSIEVQPALTAHADPALLRVVLENLIGNAVKFSARRDDARIEVFSAGDGTIGVRDNGAGFDMTYVDKIFAPFQRLHSSEYEGTGIGLALVQRIVHRHGGTIRAASTPGEGATFFFSLGGHTS